MRYLKTTDCDGDDMFIGIEDKTYTDYSDRLELLVKKVGWDWVSKDEVTDQVFCDDEIEIHLDDEGI